MERVEIEDLMKKHLDAAEAKDIDAYMETWAEDARIEFLLMGTRVVGKENLKASFQEQLFNPQSAIRTEVVSELHYKNFSTYIERITECADPNFVGLEFHWTLEFKDGKISRVWTLQ